MHFRACGSRRARLGGRLKPGEEVTGFFGTPSLTRRRGDRPLGRGTSIRLTTRRARSARRFDWVGALLRSAAPDCRWVLSGPFAG